MRWASAPDFCCRDFPLLELDGLAPGVAGFGQIGREVAKLAAAFGLRVLVHSRRRPDSLPQGAEWAGLDELFSRADIVSLHCPLTPETRHLVN